MNSSHEHLPERAISTHQPLIEIAQQGSSPLVSTAWPSPSRRTSNSSRSIPTVPGLPLVGHLFAYMADPLALLHRASEYNDVSRLRFLSRSLVLVNDAELVHGILVKHAAAFEKGPLLTVLARQMIGDGLLSADNLRHRPKRKLLAPFFQPSEITAYARYMVEDTEQLQGTWRSGEVVNIATAMTGLTLRIVNHTLFGIDVAGETDELRIALSEAIQLFVAEFTAPIHLPYDWPTLRHRRIRRALKRVDQTIYQVIAGRRSAGEDRSDLLSALLKARHEDGSPVSDREVRDEALTLFIAGHETTANLLAWTWYLLCEHPEVYACVRDEADRVLKGRSATRADLPQLPYTRMVLDETLRLFPPAWAFGRQAVHSIEIEGYRFPQDSLILISPFTLHRRADYFPDPERFQPERFGQERKEHIPRHAYIPFGAGPRVCIGNHFALMEAHLIVATLVQRVTFSLLEGQRVVPEPLISLRQKGGALMRVERREQ